MAAGFFFGFAAAADAVLRVAFGFVTATVAASLRLLDSAKPLRRMAPEWAGVRAVTRAIEMPPTRSWCRAVASPISVHMAAEGARRYEGAAN